jgi:predicted alpha/beta superfamily hydrolase
MQRLAHNNVLTESLSLTGSNGLGYQVHVSLPITYEARPLQAYPVLYVLDSFLLFGAASDIARFASIGRVVYPQEGILVEATPPELIVVAIGYPGSDPVEAAFEMGRRRTHDSTTRSEDLGEGERLRMPLEEMFGQELPAYGGGEAFKRVLIDEVIPLIEGRYRVDSRQRVLYGGSTSGHFAAFVLVTEPQSFTDYIIASPVIYLCGEDIFEREAAYAEAHDDLPANVFLSFGSREWDRYAFSSIVSSTTRLGEKLLLRNYSSLNLHAHVFQDENHTRAAVSALSRGLEVLLNIAGPTPGERDAAAAAKAG